MIGTFAQSWQQSHKRIFCDYFALSLVYGQGLLKCHYNDWQIVFENSSNHLEI